MNEREHMVENPAPRPRRQKAREVLERHGARAARGPFVRECPIAPSAYADGPLAIDCHQTISQPFIVAYMTELLAVEPQHKVSGDRHREAATRPPCFWN